MADSTYSCRYDLNFGKRSKPRWVTYKGNWEAKNNILTLKFNSKGRDYSETYGVRAITDNVLLLIDFQWKLDSPRRKINRYWIR